MIVVIHGLTGSGKTWLMTRLILKEYKKGATIYSNFPLNFPNDNAGVNRWHNLDEIYHISDGIIAIDEGQKLFDARRWASLPISFAEKIAQHRKHHLDIYTTTQDVGHIDLRVRQNIHELYHCQSLFRFPRADSVKPILQMIRITKKQRQIGADEKLRWTRINTEFRFISRFFTKNLYNTYGDIGLERLICRIKYEKKNWKAKIYSRDLLNQKRARL